MEMSKTALVVYADSGGRLLQRRCHPAPFTAL